MRLLLVLALAFLVSNVAGQYGDQQPVNITYRQYDWSTTVYSWVWSLVHLPTDYSTSSATTKYPLLVFFHGKGENSPTRDINELGDVALYGPCREILNGNLMEFTVGGVLHKFIVVCPQQTEAYWGSYNGYITHSFVNALISLYPKINQNRIYYTGISAGGYVTMYGINSNVEYASRLAAVAPVAPDVASNDNLICNVAAARVPVLYICGTADSHYRTTNISYSNYNACTNKTFNAVLYSMANRNHDSTVFIPAYSTDHSYFNPNLYEFLLQYERPNLPSSSSTTTTTTTGSSTPAPTPAPTPKPTSAPTCAAAVIGTGTGLRGDYYTGNFTTIQAVRTDSTISFDFASGAPSGVGASFPVDNFSIKWSGTLKAKYTGSHTFTANSDDGIRVSIAGSLVVDDFAAHSARDSTGTYNLVAGTSYPITVWYKELTGTASVSLSWSSSCFAKEVIPATQLTPAPFTISG